MTFRLRQKRFFESDTALVSTRTQLDLLARLIRDQDAASGEPFSSTEILSALDDVFLLVDTVSQKVNKLYGHVSMEYQLPSSDYFHSEC